MSGSRRALFKKGLVGGVLLAVGAGIGTSMQRTRVRREPRADLQLFTREEHAIFAAVAARVVPGDGAGATWPSAEALDCAEKADALLARVHPDVGADFRQLLRLFENGLTGLFAFGRPRPFTTLSPAGQDARLLAWRDSRVALLKTGYQAMVRLAKATYYASPEIYALVGYPGPPELSR